MAKPPRRSPLTPFYAILGIVALAGVGVLLYQMFGQKKPAMAPVQVAMDPTALSRVQGISMGREDAPVVIYEFADFQCPACGQFAAFVTPLVKERMVKPGQVRWVYYDFPLPQHQHAFLAARAGRCANEQGKFWEYHDLIYARQASWTPERDATGTFIDLAAQAGLDRGRFESCLRSDKYAVEVSQSTQLGQSLGVQGTPTIFVNGKRLDSPPTFQELQQIVAQEAGAAAATPAPDTAAPAAAPAQGAPARAPSAQPGDTTT